MRAIRILLLAALAAAGLATTVDAYADRGGRGGGAGRYWSGGGHWGGGSRGHWYGPRVGLYFGAPLFFGSYYWGSPFYGYYDGYYDGPPRVIYREVIREPEAVGELVPDTQVAPGPGAPSSGPLYMNYCSSAKAYYPKVTQCPEGWKFVTPVQ